MRAGLGFETDQKPGDLGRYQRQSYRRRQMAYLRWRCNAHGSVIHVLGLDGRSISSDTKKDVLLLHWRSYKLFVKRTRAAGMYVSIPTA